MKRSKLANCEGFHFHVNLPPSPHSMIPCKMNTNETVVAPPWIKLTQEQWGVYSRLRACHQLFQKKVVDSELDHDADADAVDVDEGCVGVGDDDDGANPTDDGGGGQGTCRILALLRTRELVGSTTSTSSSRRRAAYYSPCGVCGSGARDGRGVVTPKRLAKVGAWNRRRLQNMILAVGPGTPASFVIKGDELSVGNEDDDDEDDDSGVGVSMYIGDSANEEEMHETEDDIDVEEEVEDEDDDGEFTNEGEEKECGGGHNSSSDRYDNTAEDVRHDRTQRLMEDEIDDDDDEESNEQANSSSRNRVCGINDSYNTRMMSSMIHGGCINTASWLDGGWRISTVHQEDKHPHLHVHGDDDDEGICRNVNFSASSNSMGFRNTVKSIGINEYPTQLVTSGDDKLLRFWDVSDSMGRISPWPGGDDTRTPYSSFSASDTIVDVWRSRCRNRCLGNGVGEGDADQHSRSPAQILPGVVRPLATLNSGHRGNVFHVTTIPHSPGKVATCGADGFLRLHDVETELQQQRQKPSPSRYSASTMQSTSSVIISPEYHSENNNGQRQVHVYPGGVTLVRNSSPSKMCFSHHFLSSNVGLVCSEGGLLHFDLRVPPRSQKRGSLIPELSDCCRACVPWRLERGNDEIEYGSNVGGELESAYVFAGGNHTDVGLYDLRMTGSSSSLLSVNNAIQRYRPTALRQNNDVSVSGIDVSKDKREILVSYESDHIYSFPVFGGRREPTLQDVEQAMVSKNGTVPDYASYGGHLNRLTFLKMARYAGPNDEYICTGSDSGHAWIYEKATGAVVSLLKGDTSTCNGVLPHPTLPYFITYGIDSTAKLWRATTPVDKEVDDSDLGRFHHSQRVEYKKSIVADRWRKHKKRKMKISIGFFPDEHTIEINSDGPGFLHGMGLHSRMRDTNTFIGNDLTNVNDVLTKNYFQCARSESMAGDYDDSPMKGTFLPMKIRVNLMKLHHQASRLGLDYDNRVPWIFKAKQYLLTASMGDSEQSRGGDNENQKMVSYGCLADFIPDNPSDWLPFDVPFAEPPLPAGMPINMIHQEYLYDVFSTEAGTFRDVLTVIAKFYPNEDSEEAVDSDANHKNNLDEDVLLSTQQPQSDEDVLPSTQQLQSTLNQTELVDPQAEEFTQSWDFLFQTVSLLKEAGNAALKASLPWLAARRYDKAINYCAVAYLKFPVGMIKFLAEQQLKISENGGYECSWTELLQTLIMVRLNLAMVLLMPEIQDAKGAVTQAEQSLRELKPFATNKGVVFMGKKLAFNRTDEPEETYVQAKALQAKAYFRLGSAQLSLGEYDDAVKSLECSVASTREANMKVDAGLLRKLNKAKHIRNDRIEKQRKKFKLLFGSSIQEDSGAYRRE